MKHYIILLILILFFTISACSDFPETECEKCQIYGEIEIDFNGDTSYVSAIDMIGPSLYCGSDLDSITQPWIVSVDSLGRVLRREYIYTCQE